MPLQTDLQTGRLLATWPRPLLGHTESGGHGWGGWRRKLGFLTSLWVIFLLTEL